MTLQAAMQGAAGELWDGIAQAAHDAFERQKDAASEAGQSFEYVRF